MTSLVLVSQNLGLTRFRRTDPLHSTSEVTYHNQLCLLDEGTILLVTGIVLPSLSKFHYLSKVSKDVVSFCIVLVSRFRNYAEPFGSLEGGRN